MEVQTSAFILRCHNLLYKAKRRLFSRQLWVIMERDLNNMDIERSSFDGFEFSEAQESNLSELSGSLPAEFAGSLTDLQRLAMVKSRHRAGVHCVIARDRRSKSIAAACWCRPLTVSSPLDVFVSGDRKAFEVSRLFVSADYRGMSLGTIMINAACHLMHDKKFESAISLIWYTRVPSIRAHLSANFQPVGEKVTWSVLGLRWTSYSNHEGDHLRTKLNRVMGK